MKNVKRMVLAALTVSLIISVQYFRMPQILTGILINAILVISTVYLENFYLFLVSFLSPALAFFLGILPPFLFFMIPLIAIGNFLYSYLYKKHESVIIPSVSKSVFIGISVSLALFFIKVPPKFSEVKYVFIASQFITAISGALVGKYVSKKLKKIEKFN